MGKSVNITFFTDDICRYHRHLLLDIFVYIAGLPAMTLELASCVIKAGLDSLALLPFFGLLVGCHYMTR